MPSWRSVTPNLTGTLNSPDKKMLQFAYAPYSLHFREAAGTSRGVLHDKLTYLIKCYDPQNPEEFGIGEAALFRGLSSEDIPDYEQYLCRATTLSPDELRQFPSIEFGLESARRDFENGCRGIYFTSPFIEGKKQIAINGLVWMGSFDEMMARIDQKVAQGYKVIKLKIGAIDFDREEEMLRYIRSRYPERALTIRLDANGGFTPAQAPERLERLARYDVHSIEQPVKPEFTDSLAELSAHSPIPIALDESLIGVFTCEAKQELLERIRPRYIVIKPSLHGAFRGTSEWIKLADRYDIGWWITSALESNIGLSALAQFTATLSPDLPSGLGTGALYTNNFTTPLQLFPPHLHLQPTRLPLPRHQFLNLPWHQIKTA